MGILKLPDNDQAVADVLLFVAENKISSKLRPGPMEDLEELTPDEFLDYWLKWNGIIGYTHHLVEVLIDIGWTASRTPVAPNTDFRVLAKDLYLESCQKFTWAGVDFDKLPEEAKVAWFVFALFKFKGE